MTQAQETKKKYDDSLVEDIPFWLRHLDVDAVGGAQSMIFMNDMLPDIFSAFDAVPAQNGPISVLDVGPGAGHGANFLGQVTSQGFFGHSAKVTVLDIDDTYKNYIEKKHPYIDDVVIEDVFLHSEKYDVVTCSHVIEHVPDPQLFVKGLQKLARHKVVLCAPWEEPLEFLADGHLNSFSHDFVDSLRPDVFRVTESAGWGYFMRPRYSVMIMTLAGRAGFD